MRSRGLLAQLTRGSKLTRRQVGEGFGISARTAKQELTELTDAGMIGYNRSARPRFYRLMP